LIKPKRVWTFRHYRPVLVGSIFAGIYAGGLRWSTQELGLADPPIWIVALLGQGALWAGVFLARVAWFDKGSDETSGMLIVRGFAAVFWGIGKVRRIVK
jgi:hypothetical protein